MNRKLFPFALLAAALLGCDRSSVAPSNNADETVKTPDMVESVDGVEAAMYFHDNPYSIRMSQHEIEQDDVMQQVEALAAMGYQLRLNESSVIEERTYDGLQIVFLSLRAPWAPEQGAIVGIFSHGDRRAVTAVRFSIAHAAPPGDFKRTSDGIWMAPPPVVGKIDLGVVREVFDCMYSNLGAEMAKCAFVCWATGVGMPECTAICTAGHLVGNAIKCWTTHLSRPGTGKTKTE